MYTVNDEASKQRKILSKGYRKNVHVQKRLLNLSVKRD